MFGGLRADRLVSEQLLAALAPFGMEAALEAIDSLQGAGDERLRQKALALEHARYEATRVRRQYEAVDPENRLVAAELERRWNQTLTTEAQLAAELATLQETREHPLTDAQKDDTRLISRRCSIRFWPSHCKQGREPEALRVPRRSKHFAASSQRHRKSLKVTPVTANYFPFPAAFTSSKKARAAWLSSRRAG